MPSLLRMANDYAKEEGFELEPPAAPRGMLENDSRGSVPGKHGRARDVPPAELPLVSRREAPEALTPRALKPGESLIAMESRGVFTLGEDIPASAGVLQLFGDRGVLVTDSCNLAVALLSLIHI